MPDTPRMPDFVHATREFGHSLDSALDTLRAMGVGDRVTLEASGPGWQRLGIVRQTPEPGAELTPKTRIVLTVAAPRGIDHMPYALRTGLTVPADGLLGEDAIGYARIAALFDHQILTLTHAVRRAGGFFDLQPERDDIARRWIQIIFGLELGDDWTPPELYRFARFLPTLHRRAGTLDGFVHAFRAILELEIRDVLFREQSLTVDRDDATRLGTQASFLGISTVVAGPVPTTGVLITLRAADILGYRAQCAAGSRRKRETLYRLLLPLHCTPVTSSGYAERWLVGDRTPGLRLANTGVAPSHPRLGEGSYLGSSDAIGALS